ncbi:CstA-like transporter-associated (seleno)protein [Paludibacterium purpuratum]|uniref:Uncharacterized short protein YbdD (DUF466 family) n=1 Tax=Paludibacterium purpuratum TaxID=1144873 RepID=A0A4R7B867_9NEIS|nr:CstA-like transporter-associated (seleno)protein [Paludibacterium purpuratum]TDR80723.1 uncharacterized short protein YbdD (DUF466 family) [Paludibacterium purpuratum]
MAERLALWWRRLVQTARLMVGVPDYDAYLARRRGNTPPLSRAAFVRYCAERRLGGRRPGRCC